MSRVRRWYRPGLLLIGDAAHVMSSIGGVGITCAMQDAVVAANCLGEALLAGRVDLRALARVQRRRDIPTRAMQFLQHLVERQYVERVFDSRKRFRTPPLFRLPGMNHLTAYVTAYGVWPVHLKDAFKGPAAEHGVSRAS
jgi:2-polyprenyl-6-methoxyphenol hydroxylase-like FAD-dependent oxidoreductase